MIYVHPTRKPIEGTREIQGRYRAFTCELRVIHEIRKKFLEVRMNFKNGCCGEQVSGNKNYNRTGSNRL
jgi:hypothetical protein